MQSREQELRQQVDTLQEKIELHMKKSQLFSQESLHAIIQRAVNDARAHERVAQFLDCAIVSEAIQRVSNQFENLDEATETNAEVMKEILEHPEEVKNVAAAKQESSKSQQGEDAPLTIPQSSQSSLATSNISSQHQEQSVYEMMKPLQLLSEACVSEPLSEEMRQLTSSPEHQMLSQLKIAKDIDFDECRSPRASCTPRVHESCLVYRFDSRGNAVPEDQHPIDPDLHQFSPMSPHLPPRTSFDNSNSQRRRIVDTRVQGMGCEDGAPPGLNVFAHVNGSVFSHDADAVEVGDKRAAEGVEEDKAPFGSAFILTAAEEEASKAGFQDISGAKIVV